MFIRAAYVAVVVLCCCSSALRSAEPVPDVSAQDPNCACVAQGKRWAQGEEACISGISMVCGMNQNVTTWKSLGTSCQISSLSRVQWNFTAM
jgi:hypothetical protein